MKTFHLILLVLSIIILGSITYVYVKYGEILVFSPNIFMTELLKFFLITVVWTLIIGLYNKHISEKKRNNLIDGLLLSYVIVLIEKMGKSLTHKELTHTIDIIINNIMTLKLTQNFSASELNSITLFEIKLCSPEFKKDINDIEFLIENKRDYSNSNDSYTRVNNTLNQFKDVLRYKN